MKTKDNELTVTLKLSIKDQLSVVLLVRNQLANATDIEVMGAIPGLGRSPGEENGNPPQYSCLENPTDRGAWRAI